MDGGAWWATVHGVAKSRTRLSDFTFFHICFIDYAKAFNCVEAGQEATVSTVHGTTDWFQIGEVSQGYILSPCLFNLYAKYVM